MIDLDDIASCREIIELALSRTSASSEIRRRASAPQFFHQMQNARRHVTEPLLAKFRDTVQQILEGSSQPVAAYHGCRPNDPDQYLKHGLLRSDQAALLEKAKVMFGESAAVQAAVKDIGHAYLQHNHGKVWLLFSGRTSLKSSARGHCEGSEFLRAIANRLGAQAISRLNASGKTSIIQVSLPIAWLTTSIIECYSMMLTQLLVSFCGGETTSDFTGGFSLERDIPPNHIKFIRSVEL